MSNEYAKITRDGLWDNNIVFGQLLALCPVLAVTGTATNGLGMGLATTVVLVGSNLIVSLLRRTITPDIRIPAFVLIIACLVTIVDMALNAWLHDLHKVLGLFIPLIVTNCAILGRAEAFAFKNPVMPSVADGLMMGTGFTFAMVAIGGVREVFGSGTLFADASLLLGSAFAFLETRVFQDYGGFLLLILPPGGFIVMGGLMALKAVIDKRVQSRGAAAKTSNPGPVFTAVGVLKPEAGETP